jgi:hypothetical protein
MDGLDIVVDAIPIRRVEQEVYRLGCPDQGRLVLEPLTVGVPQELTGHKTDSVYRRYVIVDEGDIERALATVEAALKQAPARNTADRKAAPQERRGRQHPRTNPAQ